ncbi:MAG: hypothetical protein ACI8Z1_003265 [Candidatus Azotimanducaceae bacterium]|jgi:hypothetical protein
MANWSRIGALFIFIFSLAACGSDPGFNEAEDFAPKEGSVQFVNMIPQSPQVTIIHGLERSNATFPVAQQAELRFQDRYDWRIAYLNSASQEVTVAQGENQQITEAVRSVFFLMGSITQPDIQIVDIPITPLADQTDGTARITFASNLTGLAMVDIYVTDVDANLNDVAPSLSLNSGTTSESIETASGAKRLRITSAGTQTVVFDSGELALTEKSLELFALVDDFGPDAAAHVDVIRTRSLTGSLMDDLSQSPNVRVGNYSSNETLSLQYGFTSLGQIEQNSNSPYQLTSAGTQTYTVSSVGDPVVQLESLGLEARPGTLHSIYTFDDLDASEAGTRSIIVTDFLQPIADRSLFKFVNGGNQTIDVFVIDTAGGQSIDNSAPLLNDLTPVGTATTELPSRTLDFIVTNTDGSETLASAAFLMQEGMSYTIILDASATLRLVEQ